MGPHNTFQKLQCGLKLKIIAHPEFRAYINCCALLFHVSCFCCKFLILVPDKCASITINFTKYFCLDIQNICK